MPTIAQSKFYQPIITWPLLPADFLLPDEPVENSDQPLIAAALRQIVAAIPELLQDALIVSNFALCAAIDSRIICKAPDWMYVKPVQPWQSTQPRRSYTPNTEGPIPQVLMEFLSATYGEEYSMESTESIGKWFFYEQVIKVPTYVIFRPDTGRVEVYNLTSGRYQLAEADATGLYWIAGLELFLGVWEGTHEGRTSYWLRWWNAQKELLPFPAEQVEQERQRTEQERQRAEQERQRAEQESQRAEQESQRAEQAQTMLEQERQRAQLLLERLRELGIDPEQA